MELDTLGHPFVMRTTIAPIYPPLRRPACASRLSDGASLPDEYRTIGPVLPAQ
jgi:hypothetical protein